MCVCGATAVWVCQKYVPSSPLRGESLQPAERRAHLDDPSTKTGFREEPPRPQDGQEPEPGGRGRRPPGVRRLICSLPPSCPSNCLTAGATVELERVQVYIPAGLAGGRGLRRGNASRCNMEAGVFSLLSNKMTSSRRDQTQGEIDTHCWAALCLCLIYPCV